MKRTMSRILSMALAMMVAFTLVIIPQTFEAKADGGRSVDYEKNLVISDSEPYVYVNLGKKFDEDVDKITLKTSKKSVVKVMKKYPSLVLKKPGKATVTFIVKRENGAKKKYKMNITVVKYKCPFKSIRLNSKSLKKDFKKYFTSYFTPGSKKIRIKVKPEKDWQVKKIVFKQISFSSDRVLKSKKIKNNSTFKVKINHDADPFLYVYMYNTRTGFTEECPIYLDMYGD